MTLRRSTMKIILTHSMVYDTNDNEFWYDYLDSRGDYPATLESLKEFVVDRFINPNFDTNGITRVEISRGD